MLFQFKWIKGDIVLGYNLLHSNFNNEDLEKHVTSGKPLPDVVVVKKSFERARKRRKQKGIKRNWKLKQIMEPVETEEEFEDKEKFMEVILNILNILNIKY